MAENGVMITLSVYPLGHLKGYLGEGMFLHGHVPYDPYDIFIVWLIVLLLEPINGGKGVLRDWLTPGCRLTHIFLLSEIYNWFC